MQNVFTPTKKFNACILIIIKMKTKTEPYEVLKEQTPQKARVINFMQNLTVKDLLCKDRTNQTGDDDVGLMFSDVGLIYYRIVIRDNKQTEAKIVV